MVRVAVGLPIGGIGFVFLDHLVVEFDLFKGHVVTGKTIVGCSEFDINLIVLIIVIVVVFVSFSLLPKFLLAEFLAGELFVGQRSSSIVGRFVLRLLLLLLLFLSRSHDHQCLVLILSLLFFQSNALLDVLSCLLGAVGLLLSCLVGFELAFAAGKFWIQNSQCGRIATAGWTSIHRVIQ